MCFLFRSVAALLIAATVLHGAFGSNAYAEEDALRVCADPNNLPYSNADEKGFENRIARLLAEHLGLPLRYVWWPQRRGFIRSTLNEKLCDVVIGVPAGFDMALTTRPYYRSTYVFVTKASGPEVRSFDDAALRTAKVGVPMVGDDGQNSPPAHALTSRGIIENVRGYSVYGDYAEDSPPSKIVRAVANGEIDVAVVWGPLAGFYAKESPVPIRFTPVAPQIDLPFLPFVFDIAMAVRRGDVPRREAIDKFIVTRRADIRKILREYGVPLLDEGEAR